MIKYILGWISYLFIAEEVNTKLDRELREKRYREWRNERG